MHPIQLRWSSTDESRVCLGDLQSVWSGVGRALKNRLAPLVQGSIGHSSDDKNGEGSGGVRSGALQVVRVKS